MEKAKILERWPEYIRELCGSDRHEQYETELNLDRILQSEVEYAIRKTKAGKAAGPDNNVVEMIEALEEFGSRELTSILNRIYDTGFILEDLSKTIGLMSHVIKILLRILMLKARKRMHAEISETQCGFVEDNGISNATYMLRTIIERSREMQQDLYLCFIDYTKAFDTLKHEFKIGGKNINNIRYADDTAPTNNMYHRTFRRPKAFGFPV
ncbi:uncharacterized protein LOC119572536 [Penaeus monodon]|uniref:uncharacterized protein LOC119572536 n=1 Tax=Penaeus monodon TaxID=6687 RepID=UPI0018A74F78|nr:uncharacterized protein LOC119572536 [Penaeus monodon]